MIHLNDKEYEKDLIFNEAYIRQISDIIASYPTTWQEIAEAVDEAKELFNYFGPHGLLMAVLDIKTRRRIGNIDDD